MIAAIANDPAELDDAFEVLAEHRVEALVLAQSAWTQVSKERKRIIAFAAKLRVPLIAHRSVLVDDAALISFNTSLEGQRRRAAHIADRILRGAKPADVAVELPTTFELVLNMNTAKALGITVAPSIRERADRPID